MLKKTFLFIALTLCSAQIHSSFAVCRNQTGYPIFQCGDRAYFEPVPEGGGAIRGVFWQIGFGNATVSNGKGSTGTAVAPVGVFYGNDRGLWDISMVSARAILKDSRVPEEALCLAPANWRNPGVDGCCDNARDPKRSRGDGFLNPYFKIRERRQDEVIETLENVQDYPMAVLLKEESGRYFALAAVAVTSRNGDPNDIRTGSYSLADVANGGTNPITSASNIIPWQKAPEARLEILDTTEAPEAGEFSVRVSWDAVHMHNDLSRRPSEAYKLDNPGHGVGMADMGPLVRYTVDKVTVTEGLIGEDGFPIQDLLFWDQVEETTGTSVELSLSADECVMVKARFGKKPGSRSVTVDKCALARCGDIGYFITGPSVCLEGPLLARSANRK
jgi:hypothetical protein